MKFYRRGDMLILENDLLRGAKIRILIEQRSNRSVFGRHRLASGRTASWMEVELQRGSGFSIAWHILPLFQGFYRRIHQ